MSDKSKKLNRLASALALVLSVVLITLLHYHTTAAGNFLLHEISQRLYYVPIVYAAYSFGVRGSVATSLLSGAVYLLHISEHESDTQAAILNQYAEVLMFQVVAVVTGVLARAERRQRRRFEKASADLAAAYQELRDTVGLLIRADRLKSVGELAAAIVHEIKNPLSAIKGAAQIIEKEIPAESPRRAFVTIIEDEVDRLNRLVGEFLNFAKPRQPVKMPSDLNQLIKSVVAFTSKEAEKSGVRLVPNLDEELPSALVDSEQVKQVLLNLIINAVHATPQGGVVEVGSRRGGEFAELTVRDYGSGVETGIRGRIFDPFFTTKPEGSGLGLSVACQLTKQHGGEIELVDVDGPGSLFVVRLPLSAETSRDGVGIGDKTSEPTAEAAGLAAASKPDKV
ncbi:MAG TPA: ATP-binding protein [Blastocatellia bacterium]|nr:ATP-binding protein [Blastocatellia bacterium]